MLDYYIKLEAKLTSHPLVPSLSEVLKTLYQGCPVEPLVSCTVYIEKNPTTCFWDLHPKTKIAHDTASKSSFIDL